jgi:hypothetical protein
VKSGRKKDNTLIINNTTKMFASTVLKVENQDISSDLFPLFSGPKYRKTFYP